MIDNASGAQGRGFAVRNVKKIFMANDCRHLLPSGNVTSIVGDIALHGLTEQGESTGVQRCQALLELQKVRPMVLAVAEAEQIVGGFG